jgi:pimeloyl-ACP methyl ester carboxylesterase
MRRFPIGLLLSLAILVAAGCAGTGATPSAVVPQRGALIGDPASKGTLTAAQLDAITAKFRLQALIGTARCDVTVSQINYRTPGVRASEMSNASAAVMVPGGAACPGPFPLVAFARGTNLDKTHTVADPTDPSAQLLMTFFAAQGYAVVATDYLGYALSTYPYHPYIHADSEASAVIDSIRAARLAAPVLGLTLNGKVMLSGYSQGGHAAMAAQREIERGAPGEFNLVAAADLAGPYNVSGSLIKGATEPTVGVQLYVPFQIVAYQKIYRNVYARATDVFNAPYATYIESLLPTADIAGLPAKLPTGTPAEAQKAMFTAAFITDLATNPANGTIVAARKQDLLGWNPKAPTTLCGSSDDPVVSFATNGQAVYADFQSRGLTNVSIVDVAAKVRQTFGSVLASDPATYQSNYHGAYEAPFCIAVARQFFDQYK